jgi:hypothetical protein
MNQYNRYTLFAGLMAWLLHMSSLGFCADPSPKQDGTFVYGVTIDDVSPLKNIVDSLGSFRHRVTARIVFDEWVPANEYMTAVSAIAPVSDIMGEILDSYYVKQYSATAYQKRVVEYFSLFKDKVTIWEVGNEANGEWLGKNAELKFIKAFDYIKPRGGKTALTLYYNQGCWSKKQHEMFTWTKNKIPERMRTGLDYVWISYYEDDCENLQPDWEKVFARLHDMFPNSKIGFGECGTQWADRKAAYINRYYQTRPPIMNFVGGYFWWYFVNDMVPRLKPLWSVLNDNLL